MSGIVWKLAGGSMLVAQVGDLELVIRLVESNREYRFQLFSPSTSNDGHSCLSSGHHSKLCEAMALAEQRARLFAVQLGSEKNPGWTPIYQASVSTGPVNLNTATMQEIRSLPLVDLNVAEAILAARPFRDWEDLGRINGFYLALIDDLRSAEAEIV